MNKVRLDDAVAAKAGVTRSRARSLIIAGRVRVDGRTATKPGATVALAAKLEVERPRPYVSRGGEKLEEALRAFALEVRGMRALDVGASTGGFTDCLQFGNVETLTRRYGDGCGDRVWCGRFPAIGQPG